MPGGTGLRHAPQATPEQWAVMEADREAARQANVAPPPTKEALAELESQKPQEPTERWYIALTDMVAGAEKGKHVKLTLTDEQEEHLLEVGHVQKSGPPPKKATQAAVVAEKVKEADHG